LVLIGVVSCQYDPTVFRTYLQQNRMKQCDTRPEQIPMPLSYFSTEDYWNAITPDQRVPPERAYKSPMVVPACQHQLIQPDALNAYQFQTERFLSTLGLNIYDGAIHSIASALLGDIDQVIQYESSIISTAKTCQFGDIRGDGPCKGVINSGECSDPEQGGACGFCYGTGSNNDRTLPKDNAWSFRMIADYWALQGTVDQRCPSLGLMWTWNDYRPILGENSWAFLIAPLQTAYIKYGTVAAIPNDDISITMALSFLVSLPRMVSPVGGVYYSPKNNLGFNNYDSGFDVSTENNISLLAGLKMLRYVLTQKNLHMEQIPIIDSLISNIMNYVRSSYDPSVGFFRQGGSFSNATGAWAWHTGDADFAVDCQTWTLSVLGPKLVDSWFGVGTSANLWVTTKKLGGYNYVIWSGDVDGMGFSVNNNDQAFSGEWTFGAINMLRVMSTVSGNSTYLYDAGNMRDNISQRLTQTGTINGVQVTGVNYCNKRYWIPFGWWANAILSTASTGWAVLADSNFNPFYLGGKYVTDY